MSDFGLVQITRQRIRQNIVQAMKEVCPVCLGTGMYTKDSHLVYDLENWFKKIKANSSERGIIIKCHTSTAVKLREGKIKSLTKLQLKYFIRIRIEEDDKIAPGKFRFFSKKTGEELTKQFD
jgi:ribonuclease G